MACPASPIQYQKDPIQTTKTSFLGTYNMLGLALRNKARILFASTSEIYGDPEVSPQKESYKGSVKPDRNKKLLPTKGKELQSHFVLIILELTILK